MSATPFLVLSAILFTIGCVGVLTRRNAIVVFICVELMLNASNLALVTFARVHGNLDGQVAAFFVMVVAAAEVVVGLAIIFQGIQSVALPMVQEFGYTREIEDRVLAPMPVWTVAMAKVTTGALNGLFSALLVFPIAAIVPATSSEPSSRTTTDGESSGSASDLNSPAIAASTSSAAFDPATSRLKRCVPFFSPPSSTLAPSTSNRLPMIEPVIEALTTSMRPAWSAKNAMISSAMLPRPMTTAPGGFTFGSSTTSAVPTGPG